jgi:hypothetical protein
MAVKYQKIVCWLLIFLFISSVVEAAEQWDKHRVAFSATIGGLSGGMVGAVAGYGASYALDLNHEQTDQAGMLVGFPVGYAVGCYIGAKSQIDRMHFPDEINAGRVTAYSVVGGMAGYFWWRWTVKKVGYKKGFWQFWSIIPLALVGARIGTNNIYVPITYLRW